MQEVVSGMLQLKFLYEPWLMLKVSILMIQTTTDTGQAEVTGSNPVEALIFFFQASSFQLFKFENTLRWSFFTFRYRPVLN